MLKIKNLINGQLVAPASGEYIDNFAPCTGEVYSQIPQSNKMDVDQAVQAARNAFAAWSETKPEERAKLLMKLADRIEKNADELAHAESFDQGKPLWLAKAVDIPRGSANLRFFAHAIMNNKSVSFVDVPGVVEYINRAPIGPCALISPWNLPLYLLTWKIAPCVATGNTAICKPSELTPMTAYLLSEMIIESGFPPGVINILHGTGGVTGQELIIHPDVPVISFTGGTQTGAHIASSVAKSFKKTSFELGGKNPNIIFADCDLDKAIETTLRSSFLNQGEICLCGSRIYVEKKIYQEFMDRFVQKTNELVVGDPESDDTFVGALVSKSHLDKVLGYVQLAQEEGGKVVTSQTLDLPSSLEKGYFMRPTVITGLSPECRVQQEEIFGPVVVVTPFENEEELLNMVNGVSFGLSASLWTSDNSRIHRLSRKIQAGTVWVNSWMYRNLRAPLGGMKSSGMGREGGDYSLNFFTEIQNVSIQYDLR